jgi:hypothetical protein
MGDLHDRLIARKTRLQADTINTDTKFVTTNIRPRKVWKKTAAPANKTLANNNPNQKPGGGLSLIPTSSNARTQVNPKKRNRK